MENNNVMPSVKQYQDLNDIVFEGKNKFYGAFVIRKSQITTLVIAYFASVSLITFLVISPIIVKKFRPNEKDLEKPAKMKIVQYSELAPPPSIEKEIPPPPEVPVEVKKSSAKFLPPKVKPDNEVREEEIIPTQDELKTVEAATSNVSSSDSIAYDYEVNVVEEAPKEIKEEKKEEEVFTFVSEMPDFPGGREDLLRYLAENIRYPKAALENEIEGKVFVEFVVEKNGDISNIKVMKGIGHGCDEEVIRVVKKMPKWKPGRHQGRNIRVKYVLPVTFKAVRN